MSRHSRRRNTCRSLTGLSGVLRQVLVSFPCLEPDDTPWTEPRPGTEGQQPGAGYLGRSAPAGRQAVCRRRQGRRHVVPCHSVRCQGHGHRAEPHQHRFRSHRHLSRPQRHFPAGPHAGTRPRGEWSEALAPNAYSFMGALRDVSRIVDETGPQVAQQLKERRRRGRFPDPYLTPLHAHRRCAGARIRGGRSRHGLHSHGA